MVSDLTQVWAGAGAMALAVLFGVALFLVPTRRVPAERRRLGQQQHESLLARSATTTTTLIGQVVERQGKTQSWAYALDRAGIRRDLPEFILLVAAGALAVMASGWFLSGPFTGVILGIALIGGVLFFVSSRASARRGKFADQLQDITQLLATNLRAGHSLQQALSSLAPDVHEPARSELTRVVNEVRVGRDLSEALDETARRMGSDDFSWVAQAIAIHRQVGGNLADVLDTVGRTIRERNRIRRQVRALSAEGRMSAMVLMGLPCLTGVAMSIMNPLYLETFTQTVVGWMMLGVCAILLTSGGLWLRKLIRVEF